jgi:hypothetical protein
MGRVNSLALIISNEKFFETVKNIQKSYFSSVDDFLSYAHENNVSYDRVVVVENYLSDDASTVNTVLDEEDKSDSRIVNLNKLYNFLRKDRLGFQSDVLVVCSPVFDSGVAGFVEKYPSDSIAAVTYPKNPVNSDDAALSTFDLPDLKARYLDSSTNPNIAPTRAARSVNKPSPTPPPRSKRRSRSRSGEGFLSRWFGRRRAEDSLPDPGFDDGDILAEEEDSSQSSLSALPNPSRREALNFTPPHPQPRSPIPQGWDSPYAVKESEDTHDSYDSAESSFEEVPEVTQGVADGDLDLSSYVAEAGFNHDDTSFVSKESAGKGFDAQDSSEHSVSSHHTSYSSASSDVAVPSSSSRVVSTRSSAHQVSSDVQASDGSEWTLISDVSRLSLNRITVVTGMSDVIHQVALGIALSSTSQYVNGSRVAYFDTDFSSEGVVAFLDGSSEFSSGNHSIGSSPYVEDGISFFGQPNILRDSVISNEFSKLSNPSSYEGYNKVVIACPFGYLGRLSEDVLRNASLVVCSSSNTSEFSRLLTSLENTDYSIPVFHALKRSNFVFTDSGNSDFEDYLTSTSSKYIPTKYDWFSKLKSC